MMEKSMVSEGSNKKKKRKEKKDSSATATGAIIAPNKAL